MKDIKIIHVLLVGAILVVLNILVSSWVMQIDLTEDKRFTITDSSEEILANLDEIVYAKVLLEGEFPAGFKRLRSATQEMLDKFISISPYIEYDFENPAAGNTEMINLRREQMAKEGMVPVSLIYKEGDLMTNKQLYPYVILSKGAQKVIVNILEEQVRGVPQEEILNNSINFLEYKLINAIQKLSIVSKPNILFTTGNGELPIRKTQALEIELRKYYNTGRIRLDSIYRIHPEVDLVIVAKPRGQFDLKEQFVLDQYLMNGGKVIWLIDALNVSLDSLRGVQHYVPPPMNLKLDDMFFKYGVRFQPNLVMDLQCSTIPQVIGMAGNKPQTQPFPWPYHPLIAADSDHPIVKNLNQINLFFPSTIDTIKTNANIQKTILFRSSEFTRFQLTPVRLGFDILEYGFEAEKFNKEPQALAVLVEGEFESLFRNRVADSMLQGLNSIGQEFKEQGVYTKQLFVSDGDFISNLVNERKKEIGPVGYNRWEDRLFSGNEAFISNAIEYMLDNDGVLSSRSKEVKMRSLNKVKADDERSKWRFVNIALPILAILVFGWFYQLFRRRRYTQG